MLPNLNIYQVHTQDSNYTIKQLLKAVCPTEALGLHFYKEYIRCSVI